MFKQTFRYKLIFLSELFDVEVELFQNVFTLNINPTVSVVLWNINNLFVGLSIFKQFFRYYKY